MPSSLGLSGRSSSSNGSRKCMRTQTLPIRYTDFCACSEHSDLHVFPFVAEGVLSRSLRPQWKFLSSFHLYFRESNDVAHTWHEIPLLKGAKEERRKKKNNTGQTGRAALPPESSLGHVVACDTRAARARAARQVTGHQLAATQPPFWRVQQRGTRMHEHVRAERNFQAEGPEFLAWGLS